MRSLLLLAALSGLMTAAFPAGAQGVASAATLAADPLVAERAAALARILNSEATILGDAKSDRQVLALVEQLFASDEELAALGKKHPGIAREFMQALLPIINRSARERLPALWARQAALYAAHFTADELQTLIGFYSSPTGQKLIRVIMEKLEPTNSMAEISQSEDFKLSAKSVLADVRATGPKLAAQMDGAEQQALLRLMSTSLLPKLQALALPTQQIALDWFEESAPWEEEATTKALSAVLEKYEGKP